MCGGEWETLTGFFGIGVLEGAGPSANSKSLSE